MWATHDCVALHRAQVCVGWSNCVTRSRAALLPQLTPNLRQYAHGDAQYNATWEANSWVYW